MSASAKSRNAARYLVIALAASGAAISTKSATAQQALEEIVITATRTPSDINKIGSTVEVIDRKELEKHDETFLKDYLNRLPGVNFAQNGPPGSTGTIQIRGAASQYVKVLVDGIDVSDLAAPTAAASFEHLLIGDIERIEVLKGPQSTLYGSEAVGGLISITTRRAERGTTVRANIEAGSFNTKRFGATVSYGFEKGSVSFTAQGLDTDGFSAFDENEGGRESDGYHNLTFSGHADYRINKNLRVFFAARSTDAEVETDGFPFPLFVLADDASRSTFDLKAIRGGTELSLFDGKFVNTLSVQRTSIDREVFADFPGRFQSDRTKYEYKGVARFSPGFSAVIGADHDQTSTNASDRAKADLTGIFAQALVEPVKNLNLTAGIRRDDHTEFGTFDTYRFTAAWYLPTTGTKFRASYGTAFRAPSLFELYAPPSFGPIGNDNLDPEESRGWDVGIDQSLNQGKIRLSATYFSLDVTNLIEFRFGTGYDNVDGTTKRRGVELSGKAQLTDWLGASAAYTYTDTEKADGTRLIRVPRHVATFGVDLKPMEKLSISATAHIARDTLDVDPVTFTQDFPLDDYVLVNAKATYAVSDQLSLYVRGVNLLDDEYQTLAQYGTSDRAFYAGLTMKLSAPPPLAESAK